MHLVERRLDAVEADALGDEALQGQPALAVEADQCGEVAFGQAVAVPGRFQRSAAGEEVHQRHLQPHVRGRNTHQHNGSREIAGVERLLPGLRAADGVDHHIDPEPVGQVLDGLHDVEFPGIDGVGGAEIAGPRQLGVVGVDGDDLSRPDQLRPGDGRVTHSAAADHRDGVVPADRTGVDRRADAGHHAAAQQTGHRGIGLVVDLGALALMHQGLVGERADAQGRGQFGAVDQRHLLSGVEGVEAVPGTSALAGPALPAYGPPVEDDEVAGRHPGHALADRLDDAGRLVSEEKRVGVVDPALAVGQVGVADAARLDGDDDLARTGVGDDDVDKLHRLAFCA